MKNKSITARSSRPQRSTRSVHNRRPPSQNISSNGKVNIPHLKWTSNRSAGLGILPVSFDNSQICMNKENQINRNRHYRSGSRSRYQRSMQGSGIADLLNFDGKKAQENPFKVSTLCFDFLKRVFEFLNFESSFFFLYLKKNELKKATNSKEKPKHAESDFTADS